MVKEVIIDDLFIPMNQQQTYNSYLSSVIGTIVCYLLLGIFFFIFVTGVIYYFKYKLI